MQKKMKEHIGFETEYKIFNLASMFETVDGHFNINCKQNEQLTTKPLKKISISKCLSKSNIDYHSLLWTTLCDPLTFVQNI